MNLTSYTPRQIENRMAMARRWLDKFGWETKPRSSVVVAKENFSRDRCKDVLRECQQELQRRARNN